MASRVRSTEEIAQVEVERERGQRENAEAKRARVWWGEVWELIRAADAVNARDDYRVHPATFGAPVPSGDDGLPLDWF